MDIAQVFRDNLVVIIVLGVLIVGFFVFNVIRMQMMRVDNTLFLAQHPDAAKVYLSDNALLAGDMVEVHSVNGGKPNSFVDKGRVGVYLAPGRSAAQISFFYTRHGLLRRSVTRSTGVVDIELRVQPGKTYRLGFDRGRDEFTFAEIEQ